MGYKVIQWTTGHVGREAVKGILRHPELELVGCYAWSKDKVGRDVGELCGIAPTGVYATDDIDSLLAMNADCVCYMPTFPDIDELERILAAGKNVVSSYFINARSQGLEIQARLRDAANRGHVSLFGSGIFPGFANFIAALMASASFTRDLATELQADEIGVSCIRPGGAATSFAGEWDTEAMMAGFAAWGDAGAFMNVGMEVEQVADAVAFALAQPLGVAIDLLEIRPKRLHKKGEF